MHRTFIYSFVVIIATALTSAGHAQDTAKIRLATLAPKGTSFHQILLEMNEKWKQAPGGVSLTIYTDGTMGGEPDMVRRMRVGQLQAGMLTAIGLSEIDESVSALQKMPMMFRSLEEMDYVREKLQPLLEKRLNEKGFVVLFWADAGWVRFFTKRPAVRPDEFKKLKLFSWSGDNNTIDLMKAVGYHPVPLEYTDTLTSLQTGLIDAVPTTPFYALAGQFFHSASHMLELNWAPLVGGTIVTKKSWDALPAATRERLLKAATEAGEQARRKGRSESDEAVEAMKKRGLTVHPVSAEVEAEWRRLAESVYPKIRGRIVPADLFDEVQRILKEYRASGARQNS